MTDKRERLGDRITAQLQELIFAKYRQGDRIPTEDELSKLFSVSRITIREAIANLRSKGILEVHQGNGTFVCGLTAASFMKPILPMLKLNNADIEDILEVRIMIETKAAHWAASRGVTKDELDKLSALLEHMSQAAMDKDIRRYNDLDLEFHRYIVQYSGNEVLTTIHEMLLDLIKETIRKACSFPEHLMNSIIYHNRIMRAIAIQNPEDATKAMEQHITNGLDFIRKTKSVERQE